MKESRLSDGRDFVRLVSMLEGLGYAVQSVELETYVDEARGEVGRKTGATIIRIVPAETVDEGGAGFARLIAKALKDAGVILS